MSNVMEKSASNIVISDGGELLRLITLLIAVVAAVLFLFFQWGGKHTKFENLALGRFTTSVFGTYEGGSIHCNDVTDADTCLSPAVTRSLPRSVLWLGNSQLHGINNVKLGQQPAPALLTQIWRPRGVDVLAFSQGNASLREHYVLFEYLLTKRSFDILVLPVVFDDTREGSIRRDVAVAADDDMVRHHLLRTVAGRAILKRIGSSSEPDKKQKVSKTLQDRVEGMITSTLETLYGWRTLRKEARGSIYRTIYKTRNRILGIDSTTHRRRLPATYQANLDALRAIMYRAREKGVQVVTYIAPLRTDVPSPYEPGEYAEFKQTTQRLVNEEKGRLLDLEKLVPGRHWGQAGKGNLKTKEGLDFMHFQYAGHILLSQSINNALGTIWK